MTENWRVKTAMSFDLMPPPNLGRAISLPFSLTVVTTICWRRSAAITASLLSPMRTPVWAAPFRSRPFHS